MKNVKTLLSLAIASALTLSAPVMADDVHDADPRNTAWRGGIATDNNGEIKLVAGGGFNNLYGDGEYATQTIMIGEYFTQTEDARFRLANFDERFGGVYLDTNFTDAMDLYTVGYMLPLTATNGTTQFFPSVNYSYVDIDTNKIANGLESASFMNGYSTGSGQFASLPSDMVKHVLGGDDAHMASVNLYGLHPWSDTHYTVFQAFGGSSYGGVDLQMVDLVLLQGVRTTVGEGVFNIYLEGKYTHMQVNDLQGMDKDYIRGDEAKVSVGFDWRF
ncbi:hypothetical protein ACPV5J_03805 [Vibrio rotiferianus]|jgi:hypothetical protein|uniref:Outer membrane protein beta-barrel domain-containing protein n=1 Tax=Vibrio rotiferianus TaxID=190895 RepID=A0A510I898_9VIBR|nr:hypothetical protein [Vibrio rotiferianus]BBL88636.1 hypothetical protein VroAM7_12890 [Vibrio rotiferianus]